MRLNSKDYVVPQARVRLYLLASKALSQDELNEVAELSQNTSSGDDMLSLDDFLLPNDDPFVTNALETVLADKRKKTMGKPPKESGKGQVNY